MDTDLKEALDQISHLRALLWIAYDGDGTVGQCRHPVAVTAAMDESAAVLRKHGYRDDMLDVDDERDD